MRKSMWGALIAVLAIAGWMSTQQGDDDLVAPGKSGRQKSGEARAGQAGARGAAGTKAVARSDVPATDSWVARNLIAGVQAWQQRAGLQPLDKGVPLAWASNAPPPPPPPPPEVAPPPPPPMAPPFPHRWVGRFNDEPAPAASGATAGPAVQRAVVAGPLTTWVVKAGDVIEGQWRIDQIQDRQMRLTYLPLKQSLSISMN